MYGTFTFCMYIGVSNNDFDVLLVAVALLYRNTICIAIPVTLLYRNTSCNVLLVLELYWRTGHP